MFLLVFLSLITCLTLTPLSAQTDALVGAWSYETDEDGEIEDNLLLLSPDGTFRWEVSLTTNLDEFFELDFEDIEFDEEGDEEDVDGEEEDGDEEGDEDFDTDAEAAFIAFLLLATFELGDGELTTTLEGEWEVDGDELTLAGHVSELAIDGEPMDEFFIEAFSALIDGLAALEEELAEEFGDGEEGDEGDGETAPAEEDIEAELAAAGEEIAAGIDELFAEEITEFYTFALDGDELSLFDEDDEETVWDRVPLESAVQMQSWGQLKLLRR